MGIVEKLIERSENEDAIHSLRVERERIEHESVAAHERLETLQRAEERFFGLGALIGRKKREEERSLLAAQLDSSSCEEQDRLSMVEVLFDRLGRNLEQRMMLVQAGLTTEEEVGRQSNEWVQRKLAELELRYWKEHIDVRRAVQAGILNEEEAQREDAASILSERREKKRAEQEHHQFDPEKQELDFRHLAFVRRVDNLPVIDPDTGRVVVLRPISALKTEENPHFSRVSSHWALQETAKDPGGLYAPGGYGHAYVIFTHGEDMVADNGKPFSMRPEDTWWFHDLVLPKGTIIFGHELPEEEYRKKCESAGIRFVQVDERTDVAAAVEAHSKDQGYSDDLAGSCILEKAGTRWIEFTEKEGIHRLNHADFAGATIDLAPHCMARLQGAILNYEKLKEGGPCENEKEELLYFLFQFKEYLQRFIAESGDPDADRVLDAIQRERFGESGYVSLSSDQTIAAFPAMIRFYYEWIIDFCRRNAENDPVLGPLYHEQDQKIEGLMKPRLQRFLDRHAYAESSMEKAA